MKPEITAYRDLKEFKLLINDLPHLKLLMSSYDGFQSWIDGNGKQMFHIEIYKKEGSSIHLEYENKSTWITILQLMDTNL